MIICTASAKRDFANVAAEITITSFVIDTEDKQYYFYKI